MTNVEWLDSARESCLIDGVRYEKRWAVVNGRGDMAYLPGDMSHENTQEAAQRRARGINLDAAGTTSWRPVKILVPASPEPDKETPRVRLLDLGDDAGYTGRGPWNAGG